MDIEKEIKQLITKGKTEDAIKLLLKISTSREVIILANRLSTLKRKNSGGIITNEEQTVELNKINVEILKLFDKEIIIESPSQLSDYETNKSVIKNSSDFNPVIIGISAIGIIFFIFYIFFIDLFSKQVKNPEKKKEQIVEFKNANTACISEVLSQEHSIFWDCINQDIRNKNYHLGLKKLEESKDRTSDSKKLRDINSKINDIEIIIKLNLDNAVGYFSEELIISEKNGKEGLVTKEGKVIYEPIFESVNPQEFYPLIEVIKYDKVGFIDSTGKYIFFPRFTFANPQEFYPLISVEENGKVGFINRSGEFLIPTELDSVMYESDGMIGILKEGRWGYIDTTGTIKISPRFSSIDYFEGGLAKVRKNQAEFIIDKKGNKVSE